MIQFIYYKKYNYFYIYKIIILKYKYGIIIFYSLINFLKKRAKIIIQYY
jgi:hypothetical protein